MRSPLMSMYEKRIQSAERSRLALANNTRDNIILSIESYDIYEIHYLDGSYKWPTEDGSIEGKALARVMEGTDAATWYKRNSTNDAWEPFGGGSLILIPYHTGNYQWPTEDGHLKQDILGRLVDGPSSGKLVRRNADNNGWVMVEVMDATAPLNIGTQALTTSNIPQIIGSIIEGGQRLYYKYLDNKVVSLLACYIGSSFIELKTRVVNMGTGYLLVNDGSHPKGFYVKSTVEEDAVPVVKDSIAGDPCSIIDHGDGRISYVTKNGTSIPLNWINC